MKICKVFIWNNADFNLLFHFILTFPIIIYVPYQ